MKMEIYGFTANYDQQDHEVWKRFFNTTPNVNAESIEMLGLSLTKAVRQCGEYCGTLLGIGIQTTLLDDWLKILAVTITLLDEGEPFEFAFANAIGCVQQSDGVVLLKSALQIMPGKTHQAIFNTVLATGGYVYADVNKPAAEIGYKAMCDLIDAAAIAAAHSVCSDVRNQLNIRANSGDFTPEKYKELSDEIEMALNGFMDQFNG